MDIDELKQERLSFFIGNFFSNNQQGTFEEITKHAVAKAKEDIEPKNYTANEVRSTLNNLITTNKLEHDPVKDIYANKPDYDRFMLTTGINLSGLAAQGVNIEKLIQETKWNK
ncbi:hypothetical protein CL617_05375 [archaeon]|nr:hypothetical protein [archaeon]|tara:strand:- start:1339 stop:1677 length:339 start_codon:yes stop_codon:yes gene_type:complete